jgi:hypothetical protein
VQRSLTAITAASCLFYAIRFVTVAQRALRRTHDRGGVQVLGSCQNHIFAAQDVSGMTNAAWRVCQGCRRTLHAVLWTWPQPASRTNLNVERTSTNYKRKHWPSSTLPIGAFARAMFAWLQYASCSIGA